MIMATPTQTMVPVTTEKPSHVYKERVLIWQTTPKPKGGPRKYIVLNLPFREVREIVEVQQYSEKSGRGEQRELIEPWAKTLKREMAENNYTPAAFYACLTPGIEKSGLAFSGRDNRQVTLTVPHGEKLPLIDGQQRTGGINMLYEEADARGDQDARMAILNTDITLFVYLEGDLKVRRDNFLNLQRGKPVSRQLIKSLEVRTSEDPIEKTAYATAKALHGNNASHLFQLVGFGNEKSQISVHTLTTSGGSELATSIYGGALIADFYKLGAKWLENTYVEAYQAVVERGGKIAVDDGISDEEAGAVTTIPTLFQDNYPLTPLGQWGGSKGGSALIIGIGTMLAYLKVIEGNNEAATDHQLDEVARVAVEVFGHEIKGGISAPDKRQMMGDFARGLFSDFIKADGDEPQEGLFDSDFGIPVPLVGILSRSTFGLPKLPSKTKVKADAAANGQADEAVLSLPGIGTDQAVAHTEAAEVAKVEKRGGSKSKKREMAGSGVQG